MLILALSLNLVIPTFENIYTKTTIEAKIYKYLTMGIIDSAEYFAHKLLSTSRVPKQKKKALLYLYIIHKYSNKEKEALNVLQELLKLSNHTDSLALYRDFLIYLYNSNKLDLIADLKDKVLSDDTLYFVSSLAMFKLNKLDTALLLLEKCRLREALYLKAFTLYKLEKYDEAESLSKSINWKEIAILSFAQRQLWDSVALSLDQPNLEINDRLLPYFRALYFFSLKKRGAKVPFSYYEEWLMHNKGIPIEGYVSLLYAEDLASEGQWVTSLKVLNDIDTTQFFKEFSSLKEKYFWIKAKTLFYRGSNLSNISKHLLSVLSLTQDPIIRDSCNYLLGLTYLKFALYKKAIQYLQKVREDSNLYPDVCYNLATSYFQLSQYNEAIESIEKVTKKQDIPLELRLNLLSLKAKIYEAQKDYSKAISTYQTMLLYETRKQKIYQIHYNIEMLKYRKGDYETIEKAYNNYISKFPESPYVPQIYYDLIFKYIYSKDVEKAQKMLLSMIEKFPENSKTLDAIDLYFGSPIASLEDSTILKEMLVRNPNWENFVYLTLGRLYKKLRLYDEAVKYFSMVKPGNYHNQAQVEIMEIYYFLNKFNEVEMLGMEILPDEIREYTSYRLVELVLKALKNEGKVTTFNSLVNHYGNKDFPFKKDFCLMVSDIYIKEKDTANATRFLKMAKDLGATDQEITNYNVELLKLSRELVR